MSGGSFNRDSDPARRISAVIARLEARIRELEQGCRVLIPVVFYDPPVGDPTNIWMFPDGRLRARHLNTTSTAWVTREWLPTSAGSPTSAVALGPASEAPASKQATFLPTWSASYDGSGLAIPGDGTSQLMYGFVDSSNSRARSLLGFDSTAIAAELYGSTVTGVRLKLKNIFTVPSVGGSSFLGIHNYSSAPASWAGGGIPRSMVFSRRFANSEMAEFPLPLEFATSIRDSAGEGIAFEAPSDDPSFAGAFAGFGSSFTSPVLTVDYAK